MKIAMFSDYFFPELGGIQDSIATIARALGQRGHAIDIYAPRYGRGDYRRIGAAPAERDLGANVRVHRRASLPFPSSTRQSRAALVSPLSWMGLRRPNRPDVIHTHSFFGAGLEALLDARLLGIKLVGTNHTTITGFGPHLPVKVERAAAFVLWFYNRCDYVTAPSRSVFDEMGTLHPAHRVVSNPIDTGLFHPVAPERRAALRHELGLSHPTVTYAGRLGPEKNIDVLVQALALLAPDVELVLAGHGSHRPALEALARQLGVADRVRFLGTLPQPALADLFRASDVFALMSRSETQSMVLLQAMASGLPVVAADTRALPEFVGPENGMLADPSDPQAIAACLAALLADPDRRRRLGTAGTLTAAAHGIDVVADAWEAIYKAVAAGESGGVSGDAPGAGGTMRQ